MAALFTDNSRTLLQFLQKNIGSDFTSVDIAAALGASRASVDAVATSLQRRKYVERVEVEGIERKVIRLTAEGRAVDPLAEKPE